MLATASAPRSTQRSAAPRCIESMISELSQRFALLQVGDTAQRDIKMPWRPLPANGAAWLLSSLPSYFYNAAGEHIPMAPHHEDFWAHIWAMQPGVYVPAYIGIWPRGGGKSTSVELATAAIGYHGMRRYGLYVCNTQDQANDHVDNVSSMFGQLGVGRAVNAYGYSKGWRANRLQTEDGFMLDGIGLDAAARGRKRDEARPDLIVLDDLDQDSDTDATIAKKIRTLTRKILPMGTGTTAIIGVQNLPNNAGIFARLADGTADFLLDRVVSGPHPALTDFDYEHVQHDGAATTIRITSGAPVWVGQGLADCERLINTIGVSAFQAECLHIVDRAGEALFRREWFSLAGDYPRDARKVRFWDLASTVATGRNDPDWTAGVLMAEQAGRFWIVDVRHQRGTPQAIDALIAQTARLDGAETAIRWEEEGGASGKRVTHDLQTRLLIGYDADGIRSTGNKIVMARGLRSAAEAGNVALIRGDWNAAFLDEIERAPAGHDDQWDAASKAHAFLSHTDDWVIV